MKKRYQNLHLRHWSHQSLRTQRAQKPQQTSHQHQLSPKKNPSKQTPKTKSWTSAGSSINPIQLKMSPISMRRSIHTPPVMNSTSSPKNSKSSKNPIGTRITIAGARTRRSRWSPTTPCYPSKSFGTSAYVMMVKACDGRPGALFNYDLIIFCFNKLQM